MHLALAIRVQLCNCSRGWLKARAICWVITECNRWTRDFSNTIFSRRWNLELIGPVCWFSICWLVFHEQLAVIDLRLEDVLEIKSALCTFFCLDAHQECRQHRSVNSICHFGTRSYCLSGNFLVIINSMHIGCQHRNLYVAKDDDHVYFKC